MKQSYIPKDLTFDNEGRSKLISGITDAHPIMGGIAPAAPPMTILSGVILFSQKV